MNNDNTGLWKFPEVPPGYSPGKHIQDIIIDYIERKVLLPGARIPAYRKLAKLNKLPPNTLQRAYKKLGEMGWLELKPRIGTFVTSPDLSYKTTQPMCMIKNIPVKLHAVYETEIRAAGPYQDFTTIGFDTPSPHYLAVWHYTVKTYTAGKAYKTYRQIDRAMDLKGDELKTCIWNHLNEKRKFNIGKDNLEVVLGRRESITYIFKRILKPLDIIVNTVPRDPEVWSLLENCQATICPLSLTDDFIPQLTYMLSHTSIKALYIQPQCSYPESYTLSAEACKSLMKLAATHKFLIIEEDDYHEFWYKKEPFIPLICLDHKEYVIYTGALSQLSAYCRQTRTIVAASDFITSIKSIPVPQSPFRDVLADKALVEFMNDQTFYKQQKIMQNEKMDHLFQLRLKMVTALSKTVDISNPTAGLTLWLKFKDDNSLKSDMDFLQKNGMQIPYPPDSRPPGPGVIYIRLGAGSWDINEAQNPANLLYERYQDK